MTGAGRLFGKAGALVATAWLTAVGAVAATPIGDNWAANPDDQYLLDVKLHQYRLGDGVRAYNTPEGPCIVFGDFLTALDVPMKIDLSAKKASGWAFKESNRISIDEGAGSADYAGKTEKLAPTDIRETPEGWCVNTAALSRWFGIGVKPFMNGSAVIIETEAKLPVEMALERQKRAEALNEKPTFNLASLPQVRLPYRMWRTPALDFVVSAGVTYNAQTGTRVDRQSSVYAAGEIARLSYDVQVATDRNGVPGSLRLRAYRSDPDGELLGPLHATHFGLGDVAGFATRLSGSATSGRGAVVTNRPVATPTSFDRTRFEGDLPSGWDAELYRNGELLAFAHSDANQRYVFDDVQLMYGENDISIVLYGPQGQIRTRNEVVNVGEDNVPPGKTWYWAGVNQPGRDLISLRNQQVSPLEPKLQATLSVEHGLDDRTSVAVLARSMLLQDQRVTFVEGAVRRSVGPALVEVGASRESTGGTAARAQLLAKLGSLNISAEAIASNNFHLSDGPPTTERDVRLAVDSPIRLGRTMIPAHADVHYLSRPDGSAQLDAAARLAASIDRFNLAADVHYTQQYLAKGPAPPANVIADLIGTGRIGPIRVRGSASLEVSPSSRLRSAEIDGYWSASDNVDWEGALAYDGPQHRARVRVSNIHRFNSLALAITGEAATDGSVAVGLNLNFSLDPSHGFTLSRQRLASEGSVRARVYRDLNDNGVADPGEPFEKGAIITAGHAVSHDPTDARGIVMVAGLQTYTPITVGIDRSSLSDPMLAPEKALQVVVPRPGVPAEVNIGLVASGDIEGAILKNGGLGFEGIDLELLDKGGNVVSTARTDYDGYFLFQGVPYGTYRVTISKASADAIGVGQELNLEATVDDDHPVARLGSTTIDPRPKIASAQ
jgi:hypothetical protein